MKDLIYFQFEEPYDNYPLWLSKNDKVKHVSENTNLHTIRCERDRITELCTALAASHIHDLQRIRPGFNKCHKPLWLVNNLLQIESGHFRT